MKNGFGQKGPLLVDDDGETVWFAPMDGVDARAVDVAEIDGDAVISWWEGLAGPGYGFGAVVAVDDSYQEVARIPEANGHELDFHEVTLTDHGTLLALAYEPLTMDLRTLGGEAAGRILDNVVLEVDVATGAVLFEWHALGHLDPHESFSAMDAGGTLADDPADDPDDDPDDQTTEGEGEGEDQPTPYDPVHLNSVSEDDDGNLLLSARNTCALYKIDRTTGDVVWRLGGRASDFAVADDAAFMRQHDLRRSTDGTLTLFDNGGAATTSPGRRHAGSRSTWTSRR
ncbi:hypothetical protein GCM10025865_28210 [Paraoerskovia sediminicola]|uniref:Arylsulfotransferase (ASST) n=1 Tax=Paraoerskovia sediminicola TaxID=1138587 RepID=A0ABN6XF28_9CELL|nr:arylsulfotransferase family protein [Paraoerskovia sediminicola]BDZ43522.1 hypothetical protein GCM10025865_28210 [Paraoerskovia sediminicola]